MADKASYLSRFTMKFVEIVAAGAATAVSGYLVAHLGASWSTPAPPPVPAAVRIAPSPAETPKATVSNTPRVQPVPTASVATDTGAQRPVPQQDATPPAKSTVRATANAAPTAPSRKHPTTDATAPESKAPREVVETKESKARDAAETKPHDTAETKPREAVETKPPGWETVEARIRAALANADASRPVPPEKPAQTATIAPAPAAVVIAPPKQADAQVSTLPASTPPASTPPVSTAAVTPRAPEVAAQPVEQAPPLPDQTAAVEIKSRPIATVEASPSPDAAVPQAEPQQNGQESAQVDPQTQVKSFFSAIKHIPDMLRTAAPAANPPRPPAPVGD